MWDCKLTNIGSLVGSSIMPIGKGFPNVNLTRTQMALINSQNYKERLKGYRSIANKLSSNENIRDCFLRRANYSCEICRSKDELQLHHKIWVSTAAWSWLPIEDVNNEKNIMVLCKKCHIKRREVDDK